VYRRICSICKQEQFLIGEIRSLICKSCQLKLKPHNLGKGKNIDGWNLNNCGYYERRRNGRLQLQHRYLYEQFLGRNLLSNEHIHHKNGNRSDNRIENLELLNSREHHRYHLKINERLKDNKLKCYKCEEYKDFNCFPKRNNRPLGVIGTCSKCRSKERKVIY
jgi:hypothetical protein